jgi:2-polyprenyl-3-methyl-5-hydroxy-6-metoxy-1,4-benzoquinol methylase
MNTRLQVIKNIETEEKTQILERTALASPRLQKQRAMKAKLDRQWQRTPELFDPKRSTSERCRIQRTLELIKKHFKVEKKRVADLGCGEGTLARALEAEGGMIEAYDGSYIALESLKSQSSKKINTAVSLLPETTLPDCQYDLVLCTDVLAELETRDFRLLMSELARVVKHEGYVVCSTPLDCKTNEAWEAFAKLAETEFTVLDWSFSHHYLSQSLQKMRLLGAKCSEAALLNFEKLSRALWKNQAITHATFIGQIKNL